MKIHLDKTGEKGDNKLSIFICAYILSSSLNIAIKTLIPISGAIWDFVSLGFEAAIFLTLIIAAPTLFYRAGKSFGLVEGIFIFLFMLSLLMGEAESSLLFSTSFWTLAVCIPIGIAGISIYNKDILFKYIQISSFIEFPFLCLALLSMRTVGSYNMSASYALVLPVLFLFYQFFENKNVVALILGILSTALILFFGARGPFACVALYVFIKLFIKKGNLRTILIRIVLLSIVAALLVNWATVLKSMQLFLTKNGINSYALQRLINGQILETAGRNDLWDYYIGLIKDRPIIGYGLQGGWIASGTGPHNMLLEFILAFGVLAGGALSVTAIILFIKAVYNRNGKEGELLLILASYNFTMYFVSGNWLEKPLFFLFIFLTLRASKKKRLVE